MAPLTRTLPKPLLPVGETTLIERHIDRLAKAGVTRLVINTCYLGDRIESRLGDGSRLGVEITWSRESRALETGGGIFNALDLIDDHTFIVVSGDVYTDFDYCTLPSALDEGVLGHLVMVPNPDHHPEGDFTIGEGNRLQQGGEKALTYSGIGLWSAGLFKDCRPGSFTLRTLMDAAIERRQLSGEEYRGFWCDVGTPERYRKLGLTIS